MFWEKNRSAECTTDCKKIISKIICISAPEIFDRAWGQLSAMAHVQYQFSTEIWRDCISFFFFFTGLSISAGEKTYMYVLLYSLLQRK